MFQRQKPKVPATAPEADSLLRRQLARVVDTQIARRPFLLQARAIWRQLEDERELWPYLLPLLLVVFLGTYRVERKRANRVLADLQD